MLYIEMKYDETNISNSLQQINWLYMIAKS